MTRLLSCSQFGWQKAEKLNQTVAILNVWLRSGLHLNRKRDKTQPDTTKFFLSHYLKSQKIICLALALFGFGPFERFMARVRPNFGSVRLGIFVRADECAIRAQDAQETVDCCIYTVVHIYVFIYYIQYNEQPKIELGRHKNSFNQFYVLVVSKCSFGNFENARQRYPHFLLH